MTAAISPKAQGKYTINAMNAMNSISIVWAIKHNLKSRGQS